MSSQLKDKNNKTSFCCNIHQFSPAVLFFLLLDVLSVMASMIQHTSFEPRSS